MKSKRLSCLTPLALFSIAATLAILLVARFFTGGAMFSPGSLNAQAGLALGGVTSHAQLDQECAACHPAPWAAQTMADRCTACHESVGQSIHDPGTLHGALAAQDPALACRNCHPEHRGPSAALTVIDPAGFPHEAAGFSLTAHARRADGAAFACADCHPDGYDTFSQPTCAKCHAQIDAAFMSAHTQAYGSECLACHDGVDRFGQFDHGQTTFPLSGAHAQIDCTGCHLNPRSPEDFRGTSMDCSACHQDQDAHAGKFGSDCGACHTPAGWSPAAFDHTLAAFRLAGKHSVVDCERCHVSGFAGTPTDCYACHQMDDAHSGQFGAQCETCHDPSGWENATFDHSLAAFVLDGAHLNVACGDCHQNNIFKGTPAQCSACHAEPDFHAGLFPGQDCSACHTTSAWRPADYNGPHSFPINHGERNNVCADCHQPNLTVWTCYPCHDQGQITRKHQEEGIFDFSDCLACHPDGRNGEGRGRGGDD